MKTKKALKKIGKAGELLSTVREELVDCPDPIRKMLEEAAGSVRAIAGQLHGHTAKKQLKPAKKKKAAAE